MINNAVDREHVEPYKLLAMAIVERACKDYISAYRLCLRYADTHNKRKLFEIEKFFRSEWYKSLCDVPPDIMIQYLREKAQRKVKHMRKYLYEIRYDGNIKRGRV